MTIRRTPEDFLVEEFLTPAYGAALARGPGAAGSVGVYELRKRSLTTPEASAQLARALGVRAETVSYAGLKDKHAVTVQHVSAPWLSRSPRQATGPGWSATLVGLTGAPIVADAIRANRFTIIVRDLSAQAAEEMTRRSELLRRGDGLVFVNYFGDQRFGSARHGQGFAARHLIRGEFEDAIRLLIGTPARKDSGRTRSFTRTAAAHWGEWQKLAGMLARCPEKRAIEVLAAGRRGSEAFAALPYFTQQMCVEAYQSHLWNDSVRRFVGGHFSGTLCTPDPFGELIFPRAADVQEDMFGRFLPVLGRKTVVDPLFEPAVRETLAAESITQDDLRIKELRRPYFGEADRAVFALADGFSLGDAEADELATGKKRVKRRLVFELPRGAYATVLLRALGQ